MGLVLRTRGARGGTGAGRGQLGTLRMVVVVGNMGNPPLCGNTIRDSDAAAGGRIRKERGPWSGDPISIPEDRVKVRG